MITLGCTGCPPPVSRASTPSQAAGDSGCQCASEAGCVGGTNVSPSCQRTPGSLSGVLPFPPHHRGLLPTSARVPAAPKGKALLLGKTQHQCHPGCPCHRRGRSGPSMAWVGRGSLSGCASGTGAFAQPCFLTAERKHLPRHSPAPLPR